MKARVLLLVLLLLSQTGKAAQLFCKPSHSVSSAPEYRIKVLDNSKNGPVAVLAGHTDNKDFPLGAEALVKEVHKDSDGNDQVVYRQKSDPDGNEMQLVVTLKENGRTPGIYPGHLSMKMNGKYIEANQQALDCDSNENLSTVVSRPVKASENEMMFNADGNAAANMRSMH